MAFNFFRLSTRDVVPQLIVDVSSGDVSLQLLDEDNGEVLDQSDGSEAERMSHCFGLSPSWFKGAHDKRKPRSNRR